MAGGAEQGPSAPEARRILPIAASNFPGFRFSPTDEELISYYLQKKTEGCEESVQIIAEVEICRHEPWDLPAKSVIPSGNEWFFFSARGRKYPNGSQSRRATELGYWKATGKERNVNSGCRSIGTKRTLVFHLGRAPRGERTEWIMHEYCINGKSQDAPVICRVRRNSEFRLNDASSNPAAPLSDRQLAITGKSNGTVSENGMGHLGIFQGEGPAEALHRSSNNSHSAQQLISATEANQQLANDGTRTDSSNHNKDSGNNDEDDFYADILKDEIVNLDKTPKNQSLQDMENSWLEALEKEYQESLDSTLPAVPAPTNTLTQRVAPCNDQQEQQGQEQEQEQEQGHEPTHFFADGTIGSTLEALGIIARDGKYQGKSWLSKACLVSTSFAGNTIAKRMSARTVVVVLFVLAVFLLGGFPKITKFALDDGSDE